MKGMEKTILGVLILIAGMAVLLRVMLFLIPGITVTSWFRTAAKNESVGGTKRSAHLLGWAADIVPVNYDVENRLRSLFPFVLNEGDHIHIGWY